MKRRWLNCDGLCISFYSHFTPFTTQSACECVMCVRECHHTHAGTHIHMRMEFVKPMLVCASASELSKRIAQRKREKERVSERATKSQQHRNEEETLRTIDDERGTLHAVKPSTAYSLRFLFCLRLFSSFTGCVIDLVSAIVNFPTCLNLIIKKGEKKPHRNVISYSVNIRIVFVICWTKAIPFVYIEWAVVPARILARAQMLWQKRKKIYNVEYGPVSIDIVPVVFVAAVDIFNLASYAGRLYPCASNLLKYKLEHKISDVWTGDGYAKNHLIR